MSSYLPVIIGAVVIIATLFCWSLARNGVKKTGGQLKDVASPPPAAPVAKATATPKLMDDPAPAKKNPKAKVKAPLKAAATKAAPAAVAKPVVAKAKTAKVPAPKAAAPKTKVEAAPKPKVAKPAAKAKVSVPDNLELLKGLGPKVNTMLKALDVTSFAQVASWTAADVAEIDGKLGVFAGRISRDNWIDQAKYLMVGDVAGFEKKYGALGSAAAKG
jgi:predicted flap endonuclease-1-like 5' DNA nuclease